MNAAIAEIAQSFARDGFVIVPHLFRREEVKVFKEGIQEILQEVRQESEGGDSPKKFVDDTGVYVGLAARSGLFRQAVSDERLLDILEAIIGPNVEFLSDKVVFKDDEIHVASPLASGLAVLGGHTQNFCMGRARRCYARKRLSQAIAWVASWQCDSRWRHERRFRLRASYTARDDR